MVADAVCRDVEEAIVCDCDYMFEKYISYDCIRRPHKATATSTSVALKDQIQVE